MSTHEKPQPRINSINRPFWQACNEGKLMIQQCESSACGKLTYFPRVCCPHCGNGDLSWKEASGEGTIETFAVIRRPQHSSFFHEAPYYFIAVRLVEGPLMYSRLEHPYDPELELMGRPVNVIYTQHGENQKLPFFILQEQSDAPQV